MDPSRASKRARNDDLSPGHGVSPATSHTGTSRAKLPRTDGDRATPPASATMSPTPPAASAAVKSKLQSLSRTGQACDRCKVRKIRCDALPEGCSHCLSQNLECYVTDRVSGRTERRGYLQELEREKTAMAQHIQQLQDLLRDQAGIEALPWKWSPYAPVYPPGVTVDSSGNVEDSSGSEKRRWECTGSVWWRPTRSTSVSTEAAPERIDAAGDAPESVHDTRPSLTPFAAPTYTTSDPAFQSRPIDNYLGVFADRAPLNSVNGTQVSILGTLLDIDSGSAVGVEPQPSAVYHEPTGLYNRSLGSFLRSSMNVNPLLEVDLPSRSDAFEYSEWYFLMVYPFAPILHKPTYMALLMRVYDDPKFQATTSEMAIIHLVFASIYYQYGVRNREEVDRQIHLHDLSNKHYHWALGRLYTILTDSTLESVQALVMLSLYTRAFAKPGCGSTIAAFTLTKAIDLGLHRTTGIADARTTLANEMRKRVWWNALMLAVTLNSRLGRPMPIRMEDFDTEMPLLIDDDYLTEDGITDPSKIGTAPFFVGLHAFKLTPLCMEMSSTLYGARRDPRRYATIVRELESQYDAIHADLPLDLQVEACKPASMMYALYAHAMSLEFKLCLRHPSACMTSDRAAFVENTRICEETARKLLRHVQRLLELKSLDTTWYQVSVYCAAMFSTLAAAWERRFKATAPEIEQLQDETSIWLSIVAEIGLLAGASDDGQPFNSKLTQICARTIFGILQDMPEAERKLVVAHNAHAKASSSVAGGGTAHAHMGSSGGDYPHQHAPQQRDRGSINSSYNGRGGSGSGVNKGTNSTGSSRYSSAGNIDCVAQHLETQARLKLEVRMDPGQMPSMASTGVATSSGPLDEHVPATQQHHYHASQYATDSAAHYMLPQDYEHHMAMAGEVGDYGHAHAGLGHSPSHHVHQPPPQQQQLHHRHQHHQHQAMLYSNASAVGNAVNNNPLNTAADAASAASTNPWTNWTTAIADSQSHDRFMSADALIDLSMLQQRLAPGQPTSGGGGGVAKVGGNGNDPVTAMGVVGPVEQMGQMGQMGQVQPMHHAHQATNLGSHSEEWPLILFNEHVSGV